jgi:hypothetical protein
MDLNNPEVQNDRIEHIPPPAMFRLQFGPQNRAVVT